MTDIIYGGQNEIRLKPKIEAHFNTKLNKTFGRYNPFDFEGDKIKIELKTRRNTKFKYPSSMIGHNKIEEGLNLIKKGFKIYFVFCFTDTISYYELTENIPEEWNRFYNNKKYCYIPVSELLDF